ncbi:Sulfate/tungstate uptake family ABC transporter, permease protein [[Clostridium] ultunense Esp]|uniref:ABC transporter permease n=1 Tax=Thermicanus aegyptius TaxID=94009 RepID=UPI0002B6F3FE|nr:ABC transporter permease [Thermicanus aegyptius]CCQ98422.1 Sulfate/tungstate uptake family ABC transporter, permease protein [[Clostridium] ultunense Esp]
MDLSIEFIEIILLSLRVSITAVLIGAMVGIPIGAFLGLTHFTGRNWVATLLFTFMGMPPVLIGVIVYLLLSRYGPLGAWNALFTPEAMIFAQVLLVTPIITGLTLIAVQAKERALWETAITLGATRFQAIRTILKEARKPIFSAIATAFGRAISEVGAVMLVGGNIEHHTRVMTTAIILETRKGNYPLALWIGIVLLSISFLFNIILVREMLENLQPSSERRD